MGEVEDKDEDKEEAAAAASVAAEVEEAEVLAGRLRVRRKRASRSFAASSKFIAAAQAPATELQQICNRAAKELLPGRATGWSLD